MVLASIQAATLEGISACPVTVEANVGPGLPGVHMVGLGDAAVRESRDRIRTAVANSTLPWPRTKIMVSLSPAHLPKSGSHFDLPAALAVVATTDPRALRRGRSVMALGELGLGGRLRRVEGLLPMLIAAPDTVDAIVIPKENEAEAALLGDDRVHVADTLSDVWNWLLGERRLSHAQPRSEPPVRPSGPDFADISGLAPERFALEVAAAGGHHVLMVGSPGSGKSMLAERLPTILPPLSLAEQIEVASIHSVANSFAAGLTPCRPFVAPHPSISKAALIGGGSGNPRPGAVTLAHRGVLFLDEVSGISAAVLDALRGPLELGHVRITRTRRDTVFPASFQLIAAANPCACGAVDAMACACRAAERARYLKNLSGPLRDRIDISLAPQSCGGVVSDGDAEPSADIANRVAAARERASFRWAQAGLPGELNAHIAGPVVRRSYPAADDAMELIGAYLSTGVLTQRGVDRVLAVSWTIADLEGASRPDLDHVARAVGLRCGTHEGSLV
ncbi:Competence protein ComM [Corynebacterium capitovis DSM 44611]|uniref:YifB family Mg chelatase-like AAA ATPase n=1 Tax=Corynebacterium capitovis TaxID=131081 RepID=UPI00035F47FF|nr:YifB family Mg chelatase-like AAA ATPase [Corynebacterium capitovis]WKD57446.1 Competence protein ComM [Corynebacterium capitovis DSM 44611]